MRNILVTGGTAFVSRYTAEFFLRLGDRVWVVNRHSRPQSPGVIPIRADRRHLGNCLRGIHFDAVLDITAYTSEDVASLLDALDSFSDYILVSSSAVYPETLAQPFREDQPCGPNIHWGSYGLGKLGAERTLLERFPQGYILRPPYLYGPMQNLYREPFVFDCALSGRPFYLPGEGDMPLQFFHVEDLCRLMEALLTHHPAHRILNAGNPQSVSVRQWVELCYAVCGASLRLRSLGAEHPQWRYFCFRDYAYSLDVSRQEVILPRLTALKDGLTQSLEWYLHHRDEVCRKPYLDYLDQLTQAQNTGINGGGL